MRLVLAALVAGLCAGGLARAEDTPSCMPFQRALLSLHASNPAARVIDIVEPDDAPGLLAILNAVPPASTVEGDRIAVVFDPKEDQFLFVVGKDECAAGIMQIERSAIEAMIGKGS